MGFCVFHNMSNVISRGYRVMRERVFVHFLCFSTVFATVDIIPLIVTTGLSVAGRQYKVLRRPANKAHRQSELSIRGGSVPALHNLWAA